MFHLSFGGRISQMLSTARSQLYQCRCLRYSLLISIFKIYMLRGACAPLRSETMFPKNSQRILFDLIHCRSSYVSFFALPLLFWLLGSSDDALDPAELAAAELADRGVSGVASADCVLRGFCDFGIANLGALRRTTSSFNFVLSFWTEFSTSDVIAVSSESFSNFF